jgi:hypothetical protein
MAGNIRVRRAGFPAWHLSTSPGLPGLASPAVTFSRGRVYLHVGFWTALAGPAVAFVLTLATGYFIHG